MSDPSENLKILTEYVIKVYALTWFEIKIQLSCRHGSKHLHGIIKKSRYLSDELKKVLDPVIQRNGYFGHPENILLAMLSDERKHVRELGLRRILKSRESKTEGVHVREFKIPPLNFDADDYIDLVNWHTTKVTEPPLTTNISDNDLKNMIKNAPEEIDILKFPCHTQAVERCVKLVTEASSAVCGQEARDGFIKARMASREILPKFETKSQFLPVINK